LAASNGCRSIALPSISTGIYGYPIELAAVVAVTTTHEALLDHMSLEEVIFCCFSAADLRVYDQVLTERAA